MHSASTRVGRRISWVAMGCALALLSGQLVRGVAQADAATPPAPARTAAGAVTRESLVGPYDGGQMEVGAQLVLRADGKFEYELAYGAMDEEAKGTWELKDGAVYLTTVPAVVLPRFVVVKDTPDAGGGLWVKVSNGPVMQGARQRVYLIYGPHEEPDMVEIADDGHVPLPGSRRPTAILLEIPVYPIMDKPIPLTAGGHRMVVRFEANDIGKADFRAQRLAIENGVLVMARRDLELMLHFRRGEERKER